VGTNDFCTALTLW